MQEFLIGNTPCPIIEVSPGLDVAEPNLMYLLEGRVEGPVLHRLSDEVIHSPLAGRYNDSAPSQHKYIFWYLFELSRQENS